MGWDEVKKINSDMFVPLDERMTYIGGIIPRNILETALHLEKNFLDNADVKDDVLLSIKGVGLISTLDIGFRIYIHHSSSYPSASSTSVFNIYIDGEPYIDAVIFSGDQSNNTGSKNVISTDVNRFFSSDVIKNKPIKFNKSVLITTDGRFNTSNSNNMLYNYANISYILI